MKYPFRNPAEESALERIPQTPYSVEDMPFLKTNRYSLSSDFEAHDVLSKEILDRHGVKDNLWWYNFNKERSTSV